MTLIAWEGFDWNSSGSFTTNLTAVAGSATIGGVQQPGWTQGGTATRTAGRFGGTTYALTTAGTGTNIDTTSDNPELFYGGSNARMIVAMALRWRGTAAVYGGYRTFSIKDAAGNVAANTQISVAFDFNTGEVIFFRGPGTTEIGRSTTEVFSDNTWFWFEMDFTINGTTGSIHARINGNTIFNQTNLNTQNTANAFSRVLRLHRPSQTGGGGNIDFDDILIMDTAGSQFNAFPGEARLDCIRPASDVQAQFTRTGGTNNADAIAEEGLNSADFIDGVNGNEDIYELDDVATDLAILGIGLKFRAQRTASALYTITPKLQNGSGGAVNNLTTRTIPSVVRPLNDFAAINPTTGVAWTPAEINALRLRLAVGLV